MSDNDTFYALQVQSGRAGKAFRWEGDERIRLEEVYSAGFWWKAKQSREIAGIEGLADSVTAVSENGEFIIIRGQPREGVDLSQRVTRRKDRSDPGPHWQPHPQGRRWLMVDLDDLEPPEGLPADPTPDALQRAVAYARRQLPEPFHNTTAFYQWSSSAGLVSEGDDLYRPGWRDLRLHLWWWLSRRAYTPSVREWFQAFRDETEVPVDPKLYSAIQPHFVAAPTFLDGPDPLEGHRRGLLHGEADTVDLPECVLSGKQWKAREKTRKREREQKRQQTQQRPREVSRAQMACAESKYAAAALADACGQVRAAPQGTRHNTLSEQAFSMGTLVGAGALHGEQTIQLLTQAAESNGLDSREAERTARDGVEAGEKKPRDLTDVRRRQSARRVQRGAPPTPEPKGDLDPPSPDEERGEGYDHAQHIIERFEYRAAWLQYCDGRGRHDAECEARRRLVAEADGRIEAEKVRRILDNKKATAEGAAAAS